MLDHSKGEHFHYYQPGVGTHVAPHHNRTQRIKHEYLKIKNAAIGSSLGEHIMGGYLFLMRHYSPDDRLYLFGFGHGCHVSRVLGEMLEYIGLLLEGDKEQVHLAWRVFAEWQQQRGGSEGERKKKAKLFQHLETFRETFCRPIRRIKFMGLFDSVHSVPWLAPPGMRSAKFLKTPRTSSRVIRHAVAIDERRAKYREDLISQIEHDNDPNEPSTGRLPQRERPSEESKSQPCSPSPSDAGSTSNHQGQRYRASESKHNSPRKGQALPRLARAPVDWDSQSGTSASSAARPDTVSLIDDNVVDDDDNQDIQEVWFVGDHADIGGGYKLAKDEMWPLSHIPLVWMVQEAQQAGLQFDEQKLKRFECREESFSEFSHIRAGSRHSEHLSLSPNRHSGGLTSTQRVASDSTLSQTHLSSWSSSYHTALELSTNQGLLHDALAFNNGLSKVSVIKWRLMEYLPFRRMELQPDGSWRAVQWPPSRGTSRNIPESAQIHVSVRGRINANPNYRPGNLILGDGGRHIRRVSSEHNIGEWSAKRYEGDPVRCVLERKLNF
ncbi:hypothetical protein ABOM_003094 [Aspergillus bombycis]|uniref:T6SS Phospholipase effector Tle1-like catalytic domain-containing protein n=1 Tax=Aspergillus bombycis TaxID=109264 RepID=A0A1F8ABB9_9EURO|nr:hypothetical protein ABOM_003094 [Aspergillus bombycis]OGM48983.1 hypothetical protein ABOM_003094 [Aspergillus bombycis]